MSEVKKTLNEPEVREEILELLHKGQYTKLRQVVQELNDADIADYIEEMDEEEIVKIFLIWRLNCSSLLLHLCQIRTRVILSTT